MPLRNLKILVTGGVGFIGSHLVERLAAENCVRVLDNFSTGSMENLQALHDRSNVEILTGDVTDRVTAAEACDGMDVVFHLAVSCLRTSLNDPGKCHEVNAGGTLEMCAAARQAKVGRFVYISSSEVYGSARQVPMAETHPLEPLTVYGAAKLAGEYYAKAFHRTYGLPVIIVRPFNTYGPREPWHGRRAEVIPRFILRMLAGQPPVIFGDGKQTRDFTFVDDCVSGILLAAQSDLLIGDVVNIGTGIETSIRRVAEVLSESTSVQFAPRFDRPRPGDVLRHAADITKADELLGFCPSIDLRTGLEQTLRWFRELVANQNCATESAAAPNW